MQLGWNKPTPFGHNSHTEEIMAKDKQRQAENQRKWYQRNKERIKLDRAETSKQNKKKVRLWFKEFKLNLRCLICLESHPSCLHFHHRDPATKVASVSTLVKAGISIKTILLEIDKCDVLCANCHAKTHYGD